MDDGLERMWMGQKVDYSVGDRETCVRYMLDHYNGHAPDSGVPELQAKLGGKTPPSPQTLRTWIRDWKKANLPPSAWTPKRVSRKEAKSRAESQPVMAPTPSKANEFGNIDESPEASFDLGSLTTREQVKQAYDSVTVELARRSKGLQSKSWRSTPDDRLAKVGLDLQVMLQKEDQRDFSQAINDAKFELNIVADWLASNGLTLKGLMQSYIDKLRARAALTTGENPSHPIDNHSTGD